MKLTYDPHYSIAYIYFREKGEEVETTRISDEMVVDIAPDGSVYGIELLNANQQIKIGDDGKFLLANEASGKREELTFG